MRDLGLLAVIWESAKSQLIGPLDDVTTSYIPSGPFRIEMSERIQDHLTFRLEGRITIYDIRKFDFIVLFRNRLAD
jgi:hypothetical protein